MVNFYSLLWVFRPTRAFFTHLFSPSPVKGCKLWTMHNTRGHWTMRFFSVLHLLWNVASIHNGHLRGSVTLKPVPERLAVELSQPVFTTEICRGCDSNTQPAASEAKSPRRMSKWIECVNKWIEFTMSEKQNVY